MALTLSITDNRAGRCTFGLSTLEERRWHFGRRPGVEGVVGVVDLAARERNVQGIRHMGSKGQCVAEARLPALLPPSQPRNRLEAALCQATMGHRVRTNGAQAENAHPHRWPRVRYHHHGTASLPWRLEPASRGLNLGSYRYVQGLHWTSLHDGKHQSFSEIWRRPRGYQWHTRHSNPQNPHRLLGFSRWQIN
jgi:hypothetical protein